MSLVKFVYQNKKYYKENKELSAIETEKELGHYRFLKLKRLGKYSIRVENPAINSDNNVNHIKSLKKKETLILNKNKALYRVEEHVYKGILKIELWKKNLKYGYSNFITYLDNKDEDTINQAILKDIKTKISK